MTCSGQTGFFFLKNCQNPISGTCPRCSGSFCMEHLAGKEGVCLSCESGFHPTGEGGDAGPGNPDFIRKYYYQKGGKGFIPNSSPLGQTFSGGDFSSFDEETFFEEGEDYLEPEGGFYES